MRPIISSNETYCIVSSNIGKSQLLEIVRRSDSSTGKEARI
jgi:hypothetical protein